MLKIAIVGCGKIADSHATEIRRIEGCEIVAVCDREPLMARQLAERFRVKNWFRSLDEALGAARPDVVHITTPPESHFELARLCLDRGCHTYVEKPFTVNADQAERLLAIANERRLKLTAGHNSQFTHAARRMRAAVESGWLGGEPVHIESYYGYDLGDPQYARALLGDKQHWVRRLPGMLLQNVISHGIASIAEFVAGNNVHVIAYGFASPLLQSIGESDIVDELRVIVSDEKRTTAYFTFSTQMRPVMHLLRIYGPKNGLVLDQDHEVLLKLRGQKYKSYADKFIPPALFARQYLGNLIHNAKLFAASDFHMDSGMKHLIEAFYQSIREGSPVPITYREILLTARIMDAIFAQVGASHNDDGQASEGRPRAAVTAEVS